MEVKPMTYRIGCILSLSAVFLVLLAVSQPTPACCPAPPSGKPVVNADQTVILLWDPETKTEHFIRRASFKSDADDFGFIVPTPSKPELSESGDAAFPLLQKVTEPEHKKMARPTGNIACGCASASRVAGVADKASVRVLEEKVVAGFKAAVLEADNADVLINWLKENGYAFSPEVKAWAKPYVEGGWKLTALKVAKPKEGEDTKSLTAAALRLSFKTDRPLFPYREPDPTKAAETLGAKDRLLRIYFISDKRYQGELTKETAWTGKVAWAGTIGAEERQKALGLLRLPETTGPAQWYLTEFEDNWPYRPAPADVYFSVSSDQGNVRRPPIIEYTSSLWPTDVMACALAAVLLVPPVVRRVRRDNKS
jgi:hypothetical protein